jgi:regulator of cell morphogenesis and NO signaling
MDIRPETQIAEVASAHPATIRVFQHHGVDFCCGGKRPLSEVCGEKGLAFESLAQELSTAIVGQPASRRSWQDAPLGELVSFIVDRYHQWLKDELPRLTQMMNKVLAVHGQRHPELQAIGRTFEAILGEIGPHMAKEERVLFPYLTQMAGLAERGEDFAGSPFGSVRNPIGSMEFDHEALGDLLRELRKQTADFTPPEDACNTYRDSASRSGEPLQFLKAEAAKAFRSQRVEHVSVRSF